MQKALILCAAIASIAAGCGGGYGSSRGYGGPLVPVATNTPPPTIAPMSAGDAKQANINGRTILVDANSGLALYVFNGDGPNQSNCTGGCLAVWPAHAATASERGSGDFTIFTRQDGSRQWAFKGRPLYTFVSDTVAHNATGDNFQNFFLATP